MENPNCSYCKHFKMNCQNPNFAITGYCDNKKVFIQVKDIKKCDDFEPIKLCEMNEDVIQHPKHYCFGKYEPKDVIRDWGLNFNLGSTIKYIARAGRKDDIIQDLKKAKQFLEFEIEALEEERKTKL